MNVPRKLTALAVVAAALGAPAAALADGGGTTPFIQHWSAFSGGKVGGYTVGDVIQLQYKDPSGSTRETQFCWSPAPIARPACSTANAGAPAQTGTQTVTAQLGNGQQVSTQFHVGPANTVLGSGSGGFTPPVPYTVNGAMSLFGNASMNDPIASLAVGQQVGGYSSPRRGVTQVYDYATNQAGFFPSALLTGPASPVRTWVKTATLKPNRTTTYTLNLPRGFKAGNAMPGATAISYSIYRGSLISSGTSMQINPTGPGSHTPFLGARVLRATYTPSQVIVKVRTGTLEGPIHLRLAANGTV